ncbi:MAG TPA: hypothetical protein ENK80_01535 [Rhodobacterales bacterium]|nr:hypothetical protein [Rhodobacterales bacterium]
MRRLDDPGAVAQDSCWPLIKDGLYLEANATLGAALALFEEHGVSFIPVVTIASEGEAPELWGSVHHMDALKAYNRALASTAAEEHA